MMIKMMMMIEGMIEMMMKRREKKKRMLMREGKTQKGEYKRKKEDLLSAIDRIPGRNDRGKQCRSGRCFAPCVVFEISRVISSGSSMEQFFSNTHAYRERRPRGFARRGSCRRRVRRAMCATHSASPRRNEIKISVLSLHSTTFQDRTGKRSHTAHSEMKEQTWITLLR